MDPCGVDPRGVVISRDASREPCASVERPQTSEKQHPRNHRNGVRLCTEDHL